MKLRDALELLREMNRDSMGCYILLPNGLVTPYSVTPVWDVYDLSTHNGVVGDTGQLIARANTAKQALIDAHAKVMAANK